VAAQLLVAIRRHLSLLGACSWEHVFYGVLVVGHHRRRLWIRCQCRRGHRRLGRRWSARERRRSLIYQFNSLRLGGFDCRVRCLIQVTRTHSRCRGRQFYRRAQFRAH
jgi:hypothetical protein